MNVPYEFDEARRAIQTFQGATDLFEEDAECENFVKSVTQAVEIDIEGDLSDDIRMGWHMRYGQVMADMMDKIAQKRAAESTMSTLEAMQQIDKEVQQRLVGLAVQMVRECAAAISEIWQRVSELQFFTVEAVRCGEITVSCKSKTRTILVPGKLKSILLNYAKRRGITNGAIFVGKNGKPLDRSSIWRKMKQLCKAAGVKESKVFPHNLRKLFARTFYGIEKDIAKLADILGHSSINTTRIYIMTTGVEHRRKIERLGLVV